MSLLITVAITAIITILLDVLSNFLMSMALGIAFGIPTALLNSTTTTFVLDDGNGGGLLNILPVVEGFDLLKIFKIIGWALLIGGILISLLKSMSAGVTGELEKSPGQVLLGGILSVVMMIAIFGIGNYQGLIYYFGELMNKMSSLVTTGMIGEDGKLLLKANELRKQADASMGFDLLAVDAIKTLGFNIENNGIVKLIFCISMASGVVMAAITHIERFLSLIVYLLFGPVCIGFSGLNETKETTKQWFLGIVTQTLAILLSLALWRVFFVSVIQPWTILNMAITVTVLMLIKNSEKFLNSIGLRTMPNQDTAQSFMSSFGSATGTLATGFGLASMFGSDIAEGIRDKKLLDTTKRRNLENDIINARKNHDPKAEELAKKRYAAKHGLFKDNNEPDSKMLTKANAIAEDLTKQGIIPSAQSAYGNNVDYMQTQAKASFNNAKSFADIEKAKKQYQNSSAGINNPKITYSDSEIKTARDNLDSIYQSQIAKAGGNEDLIKRTQKEYEGAYKEMFGSSPTNMPHVASINKADDGGFTISSLAKVDESGYADIKGSIDTFNNLLSNTEQYVKAGTVGSALSLDRSGYIDHGAMSAHITTATGEEIRTALMSVSDEDGKRQMYIAMPSDFSVPNNSFVSADISGMENAHYAIDGSRSLSVGDGSISLIPIDNVPLNAFDEKALIKDGLIKESFNLDVDEVRGKTVTKEALAEANVSIVDSDNELHKTFSTGNIKKEEKHESTAK